MSKANHGAAAQAVFTPGPWHVDAEKYSDMPGPVYGADGFEVAEAVGCAISELHDANKGHWGSTPGSHIERNGKQIRANARLIAAAPDLYAALRAIADAAAADYDDDATVLGMRARVLAALAKAEGRSAAEPPPEKSP